IRNVEQVLAGVVVLGAQSRAARGHVIEVEPPAGAGQRRHAEQVPHVERRLKLSAKNLVVAEVKILNRAERVVRVALNEGQVKDRNVFDFQEHAIATHQLLRLVERLAGQAVGDGAAEDRLLDDFFLLDARLGEYEGQARIAGGAAGENA